MPFESTLLSFGDYMQDLGVSLTNINSINTSIPDHNLCQQARGQGMRFERYYCEYAPDW